MRLLANIIWLVFGGLLIACSWAIIGLFLCLTVIGIPLSMQAFKMAGLTLAPFGSHVVYGGGAVSMLVNVIWVLTLGWMLACAYIGAGIANCITIIGIPFGIQSFKMAKLALFPFGATVV